MLIDLVRAAAMFTDAAVRRTFLISLAVAVGLLAALFPLVDRLVRLAGTTGYVALDRLLEVLGLAGTAILAWLLFPAVVAAVLGFLLDRVVEATERRHFPALPPAREPPLLRTLLYSVGFGLLVLALNLVALPLYLVPGLNIPVYLALNSYLLGREYVELVMTRREGMGGLKELRRRHQRQLWGSGLVTALILMVPIVNIVAPIIGSAFATLRLHKAQARLVGRQELLGRRGA